VFEHGGRGAPVIDLPSSLDE
jgi:hypothetical protein